MTEFYDRQGRPITMEQWSQLRHGGEEWEQYRRVARTEVTPSVVVSTVWLGLDHGFTFDDGPHVPIIFETMVFGGPLDQEQWRYATEAQAVEGHGVVVSLARREEELRDTEDPERSGGGGGGGPLPGGPDRASAG